MKHLSLYESFAEEMFDIPIFNPWTNEEDELLFDMTEPVLREFESDNFILDEPSRSYGDWQDVSDLVCPYWLVHKAIQKLRILDTNEMGILKEAFPDRKRSYEYKNSLTGQISKRESTSPQIFGTFYWYSVPAGDTPKIWSRRKEMIWLIAKDSMGRFRAVNGEEKELRSLWDKAKKWDDLKSLIESEIPKLKDIAQYFEKHLELEIDEWESEARDYHSGYLPYRQSY
jgi:hypothetical protein